MTSQNLNDIDTDADNTQNDAPAQDQNEQTQEQPETPVQETQDEAPAKEAKNVQGNPVGEFVDNKKNINVFNTYVRNNSVENIASVYTREMLIAFAEKYGARTDGTTVEIAKSISVILGGTEAVTLKDRTDKTRDVLADEMSNGDFVETIYTNYGGSQKALVVSINGHKIQVPYGQNVKVPNSVHAIMQEHQDLSKKNASPQEGVDNYTADPGRNFENLLELQNI